MEGNQSLIKPNLKEQRTKTEFKNNSVLMRITKKTLNNEISSFLQNRKDLAEHLKSLCR